MSSLEIHNIHKQFEDNVSVLYGVDLSVGSGEIACLLGPSGCGKTTLLRILAGLEMPDQGTITLQGQDVLSIPAHRRGFGLMFQDYALFPHLDVAGNIAFGLRMQRWPPAKIEARTKEMLDLVHLGNLAHRDIGQLSGGEQQRVALARALAPQPRLLMLDEPIGALDRTLRDRLLDELRRILKDVGITVIYVTHDQNEAFTIGDQIFLMNGGRIVQRGTPDQVYRYPANPWAARFLGMQNLIQGEWSGPGAVHTSLGTVQVTGSGHGPVTVLIRPEAARLGAHDSGTTLAGTVVNCAFLGSLVHLVVSLAPGIEFAFHLPAMTSLPQSGAPVTVTLCPEAIICLSTSSTV